MTVALRRSWAKDLDAATLYELLKLRVEVFVVEQACPYPELDGRDLLAETRHFWLEQPDGEVRPEDGVIGLVGMRVRDGTISAPLTSSPSTTTDRGPELRCPPGPSTKISRIDAATEDEIKRANARLLGVLFMDRCHDQAEALSRVSGGEALLSQVAGLVEYAAGKATGDPEVVNSFSRMIAPTKDEDLLRMLKRGKSQ